MFFCMLLTLKRKVTFAQQALNQIKNRKKGMHVSLRQQKKKLTFSHTPAYKRISPCLLSCKKRASITVEAALVLPLFLFALLNIISIIEIYRVQSNVSGALHTASKEMAIYGYAYNKVSGEEVSELESVALTYIYGANRVKDILGKDYLNSSPIVNGEQGLHWTHTKIMQEECIDLAVTYQVAPFVGMVGFDKFPMYNRMRTRAWTGYDNTQSINGYSKDTLVYITENGSVYHITKNCSYLRLSIRAVNSDMLEQLRNESGSKYYACEHCKGEEKQTVFITSYGTRYHTTVTCSGIKRSIQAVLLSEVGDRPACSKCGE